MKVQRRGSMVVEVLLAGAILAVGVGGVLQLGSGETRRVRHTRQRAAAQAELARLREALRTQPATFYARHGLLDVAAPEDFTAAHAAVFTQHPLLRDPPEDGVERFVLAEAAPGPQGYLVTYLVRFPVPGGGVREVSARRYVE